jgi:hypothetical protein
MLKRISYVLFFLILIIPITLCGQEKDFNTWLSLGLKGELFNRIDFVVTPELRLLDNSTRIEAALCELEVTVPLYKYFQFGVAYRAQLDVSDQDYTKRINRFGVFAGVDYKVKRFRIAYRAIYHQEYTNMNSSELGDIPEAQHRHKISLKYDKKKWQIKPYASAEMFFTLKPAWNNQQRKLRTTLGIQYIINKNLSASVAYKFQQEYFKNNPSIAHILSIGLVYELGDKKNQRRK